MELTLSTLGSVGVTLLLLAFFAALMFSWGTRAAAQKYRRVDELCYLKVHWFFGWWATCYGDCPGSDDECRLQWRRKGSEDPWQDEHTRGESWAEWKEYRCVCLRRPVG